MTTSTAGTAAPTTTGASNNTETAGEHGNKQTSGSERIATSIRKKMTIPKKMPWRQSTRKNGDDELERDELQAELSPPTASKSLAELIENQSTRRPSATQRWLKSFGRSDPRFQIKRFFNHLSEAEISKDDSNEPAVFTVWRPTSAVAIRRMISGEATGKGLEIKGKSAKAGKLSGYVPFLQIHEEEHKKQVMTLPKGGRTRVFFATSEARDVVLLELEPLQNHMVNAVQNAKRVVKSSAVSGFSSLAPISTSVSRTGSVVKSSVRSSVSTLKSTMRADKAVSNMRKSTKKAVPRRVSSAVSSGMSGLRSSFAKALESSDQEEDESEWAFKRLVWDMDDPSVREVDDYAPSCYGIELPDRLLWQALVVARNISRPEESDFFTDRPSQAAFQDMNFIAIHKTRKNGRKGSKRQNESRVVLWQTCGHDLPGEDPMDARGLIMAYEEDGRVLPVVSDFDCFTVGTRGIKYETPLPPDQAQLLLWCVSNVKTVLEKQNLSSDHSMSWTMRWLDVLKASATQGFHPTVPKFGFGDEKSYLITESAVSWLKESGAVRHGAECFNYYFPQQLDDEFLVVSDALPGESPWKYVNECELRAFLSERVDEGFTFPLNPKWVLCDRGWKTIYDRLMSSEDSNVQDSLNVWFPPESGVRETIKAVSEQHPGGFIYSRPEGETEIDGTEAMDLATLELRRYLALQRAKVKLRAVITFNSLLLSMRRDKSAEEDDSDFETSS